MKNDKPLISIIVPAYNVERYILRCLDSIKKQTYKNIEVIVVDDGSTDMTGKILDAYKDFSSIDIKIIHIPNGGVTNARLTGIRCASGEWIGFVDGDDVIEEDMFELLINNAVTYKADISHCGYQMIFEDGHIKYFYNSGRIVEQNRLKGIEDLLDGTLIEPGLWNKLFHKSLVNKMLNEKIIDLSIKNNEDLLMNFYLFSYAQKSVFQDVCKYHYMVRNFSASRQSLNIHMIWDPIVVKETIYKESEKKIKMKAAVALIDTYIHTYCALTQQKTNVFESEKEAIRNRIIKHKEEVCLLGKRTKFLAKIIINFPCLLKTLYFGYSKFFQKKQYE